MSQLDRFLRGEVILNCKTEELAKRLARELRDITGENGVSCEYTYWENHKENTCYDVMDNDLAHSSRKYYEEQYPNTPIEDFRGADKMELTFSEVIAKIKRGETYECVNSARETLITYANEAGGTIIELSGGNGAYTIDLNARFRLRLNPVTFSKAMASGKKIRFGRRINENYSDVDDDACLYVNEYSKGGYLFLSGIMSVLGHMYSSDVIREIMAGDWYIEGE